MNQANQEYFHDLHQRIMAEAEANQDQQLPVFMNIVAEELMDTGFIEDFVPCYYNAQRGIRVDGYCFNDEGALNLFIADFRTRDKLASLSKTDVDAAFKRLARFFDACVTKNLFEKLEETSPAYGLARQIKEQRGQIGKVSLFLFSERVLSDRVKSLEIGDIDGINTAFDIWDISRLQKQESSRGRQEILEIDFSDFTGSGISCLPADSGAGSYPAYLAVMPAGVLSDLYDKYGARLLEQNVRCFLQARGKVNKGIKETILNKPEMFFAYNNGITATAQRVKINKGKITNIQNLQIVNGGQTVASLFHTHRKDGASLEKISVQMKLTVISGSEHEEIVPEISKFANTQNRVNAADFFSNHPFHIRIEECSRRKWAPAQENAVRETKWFYERARGQYADAQSKLTPGEKKRFQAEYPKPQMFTKTDLAKFENVWDEKPRWVNLGAQKNFAQYAKRIGQEWEKHESDFNDYYYKRAIARAILFRATEKLVSRQDWYDGGYRANIVAYTLAMLGFYCEKKRQSIDFMALWKRQGVPDSMLQALAVTAKLVYESITRPPQGVSNVTEWCKKDGCWDRLQDQAKELDDLLPEGFQKSLINKEQIEQDKKDARGKRKIDGGIEVQTAVSKIPGEKWRILWQKAEEKGLLTAEIEAGILKVASQIPNKIPSEKQCKILAELVEKLKLEGLILEGWAYQS